MRYTYRVSPTELVEFHANVQRKMRDKIEPLWWLLVAPLGLIAVFMFGAHWIIGVPEHVLGMGLFTYLILVVYLKIRIFVLRKQAARYYASLPDGEAWTCEVNDGYCTSENRGVRFCFPLSGLTRICEQKESVYLDFDDRGCVRIPFHAFPSVQEREEFVRSMSSNIKPKENT